MTPHQTEQLATALAAILDASLSSLDPSGAALRRTCQHLSDGLRLAEQMGVPESDAARIVREVVNNIEDVEQ